MMMFLVVTQGASLGARLEVGESPRRVGRAKDCDLVLLDPAISRAHLTVCATGDGLEVRCAAGASPFFVDAMARTEATLRAGDKLLVGDTVLTVGRREVEPETAAHGGLTVRELLAGAGADIRGLGAIFALVDVLDDAAARDELDEGLRRWAQTELGARQVLVGAPPPPDAPAGAVLLRESPNSGFGWVVTVSPSPTVGSLSFELPLHGEVPAATQRLLAVAARVYASSLAHHTHARSAETDRAALRKQAVGSASAFLGDSPAARQVDALVPKLAASDATALILGESGVGKTFVARLIHEASRRAKAPLRVLNCAAIPDNLVESELFGHERGAFTGADAARAGAFESAGEGTILLDEIGELPLASQAKLLRVLEDRAFERLGSNRPIPLRARVIAATNRDLAALSSEGKFRSDLFFRISVVTVRVPALRERGDDIVLLARRVLADLSASAGRRVTGFSVAAQELLCRYTWPGNVRELRNAIEHALVLGDGPTIEPSDFPESVRLSGREPSTIQGSDGEDLVRLPANLAWLEGRAIEAALRATGGNRTQAAAILGINRATLYKKGVKP